MNNTRQESLGAAHLSLIPATLEAEAKGLQVQGQPQQLGEILSQKIKRGQGLAQ